MCNIAGDVSPGQSQIEASDTHCESDQHIYPPIPAMKDGKASPDLRNKLKRSAENYRGGEQKMRGKCGIADCVAGDISMGKGFVPRLQIPSRSRKTIETRYGKREYQLADDGHHKPRPCGYFQGGVRNGIQFQSVGPYSCAHTLSASGPCV